MSRVFALLVIALAAQQSAAPSTPGTYVNGSDLKAAIDKAAAERPNAMVSAPVASGDHYGINLVHRTVAAGAIAHPKGTEVHYITDGGGTFVTGGRIVRPDGGGSATIEDGVSRHVTKGDVVFIPAGTPHWYSQIDGFDHVPRNPLRGRREVSRRRRTHASASARPVPARSRAGDPAWLIRGLALLLFGFGAVAYANSLANPFVFDDIESVVENATIHHLWPLGGSLVGPIQSATAGRPLVNLSFAVNYAVGGLDPWGYHVWNLAIHLSAALVLFGLVRRTLQLPSLSARYGAYSTPLAFVSALVWMIHPLQTEVVNYVTQRTESMMGLCYLATLYAALRASVDGPHRRRWAVAAVVVCAAGMACKESMASAPLVVVVYAAVFLDDGVMNALRRRPSFSGALAATWLVLFALNWNGPRARSAGFAAGVTPWIYLQDQAVMLVRYLRLALWPRDLVIYYGLPGPVPLARVLPGALLAVALAAGVVLAWRRRHAVAFLGIWFAVTLAPTTSIIPIATEVGAERRMYLPLAALVVMAVIGAWQVLSHAGAARGRLAAGMAVVACLPLAVLTVQRNAEYHSSVALWRAALERYPNGGAHYGLGMALREAGQLDESMAEFRAASADYPEADYALGVELDKAHQPLDALDHYRRFVERRPLDFKVPATYRLMGLLLKGLGRFDEAEAAYRRSLEMQPDNGEALRGLAEVLYEAQRYDDAAAAYRRFLDREPGSADGHNNLGLTLVGLDWEADAVSEFQQAAALSPDDVRFARNLGNALSSTGRLQEAAEAYRRGLTLAPDDAELYSSLGLALAGQGKAEESRGAFQQAIRLAPDDPRVRDDLATAMRLLGIR